VSPGAEKWQESGGGSGLFTLMVEARNGDPCLSRGGGVCAWFTLVVSERVLLRFEQRRFAGS